MNTIELPTLSIDQIHSVERLMTEIYGIDPLQTMENAGRNLAVLAKRQLDDDIVDRSIVVLIGPGNHGGVGLVAARHLLNWGAWVQILLSYPSADYTGVAARQLSTLQAMDAPLAWAEEGWELPPADLVIDAIIGDDAELINCKNEFLVSAGLAEEKGGELVPASPVLINQLARVLNDGAPTQQLI